MAIVLLAVVSVTGRFLREGVANPILNPQPGGPGERNRDMQILQWKTLNRQAKLSCGWQETLGLSNYESFPISGYG